MNLPIFVLVNVIEMAISKFLQPHVNEKYWVTHYGAMEIHPRHLVYWICVQSDLERDRLNKDMVLRVRLRDILDEYEYPLEGRNHVMIGFESQETVDRESNGHWWHHWK